MAAPVAIILNDHNLTADHYVEVRYEGVRGLFEPAVVERGAVVSTFGGRAAIRALPTAFEPRTFEILGHIINSTWLRNQATASALVKAIQGRPTRVQVGSLYLDAELEPVRYDRFLDLASRLGFAVAGEATSPLWTSLYGYSVGVAQGITVIDDRLDHTSYALTSTTSGAQVAVTNPGDAPTNAAIMIDIATIAAATTYYLRNTHAATPARIVFTTDATGAAYIGPDEGFILMPGANWIRVENSAGVLVPQTTTFGFYGTPIKWLGNGDSADTTSYSGRFNEPIAPISLYRRGSASHYTATATRATPGDMAPRVGDPVFGTTAGAVFTTANVGLILEQASTNILTYSEDFTNAAWTKTGTTTGQTDHEGGATAVKLDLAVVGAEILNNTSTAWGTDKHTFSIWAKGDLGTEQIAIRLVETTSGTVIATETLSVTTTWKRYKITGTGAGANNVRVSVARVTTASFVLLAFAQDEALPFPTSYIATTTAAVTRNADIAGVTRPQNYLMHTRDLTQNAAAAADGTAQTALTGWLRRGVTPATAARAGTAADGTATCTTLTFADVGDSIYQIVQLDGRPSTTPVIFAVALRLGTIGGGGSIDLKLKRSASGSVGTNVYNHFSTTTTTNVLMSDLSANATRTSYVSATPATTAADVMVEISGNTGTGTVLVESCRLVRSSYHPGRLLVTEGTAVPMPAQGWEWPEWGTQNGYIEVKAVLPPISTGANYAIIGQDSTGSARKLAIRRLSASTTAQNYLTIDRSADGANQTTADIDVGAIWDGALHTIKLIWKNYELSGTQYMYLELDIDGVNKSASANLVTATVTKWTADEMLLLSDGKVQAVIRNLTIGVPTLPANSIPAQP